MNTPDPPPVPDPTKTAAAQGVANKETAVAQMGLNAVNQITPSGSLNYSQIGKWEDGTPRFQAEQTYSPANQQLFQTNQATQQGLSNLANTETGKISEHLATPFSSTGLPSAGTTPGTAPGLMGNYGVERASGQIGPAGPIQTTLPQQNQSGTIGDAGPVQRGVTLGNQSGQIADVGALQRGVGLTNQSGQIADVGGVQRSVGPTVNSITGGYGPTDYSSDRSKVENALYSRINPQLDRDRQARETQLINAGVRPGTAAWDRAQDQLGRNANDARQQAVLAGGAEQSRLAGLAQNAAQFQNTAQGQEFAQRLQEGMFGQTGQQQAFGQAAARTSASDAATAANNAARLAEAQFGNTAQQAAFGQAGARTAALDAATQANNAARLQEGQFTNTAQGQQFGQNTAATAAANAATEANNAARAREATFGRESQGLQFTQNQAQQQAADAAALANTETNRTALTTANATGQQTFANQQAIAAAQDQARQRALQERLTFRNQPINEITSLMSGSQVSQPGYVNAPTAGVAPTDVIGATNAATNANMNVYNQQLASQNAMMGGLFGLAGNGAKAFALSDVRAKEGVKRVGKMDSGLPIYAYSYKGDPDRRMQFGLMAQDVETVLPEAVAQTDSGLLAVNYGTVAEALA